MDMPCVILSLSAALEIVSEQPASEDIDVCVWNLILLWTYLSSFLLLH